MVSPRGLPSLKNLLQLCFLQGLAEDFKIVLVEAGEVLGTFDRDLRQYASGNLQKIGVEIK
jgi:NADH dehydrogenase FAD-containing subunit